MDQTVESVDRVDGRTARRDRNRVAVLDAALELFADGNLTPGVHDVAERSGVSLRSVYRYFQDMDELIASAINRQLDLSRPLFELEPLGEGPLDPRIERFVHGRVALYDRVRPVFRAAVVRAAGDPLVHNGLVESRAVLRRQTAAMFAPELGGPDTPTAQHRLLSLDLLTQLDTLEYLFGILEMTPEDIVVSLTASISDLLHAVPR